MEVKRQLCIENKEDRCCIYKIMFTVMYYTGYIHICKDFTSGSAILVVNKSFNNTISDAQNGTFFPLLRIITRPMWSYHQGLS